MKLCEISENQRDVVKFDIPLFIRLLEYAREDAKTDMDLHDVAEAAIRLCQDGRTLSMSDYAELTGSESADDSKVVDLA